MAEYIDRLGIFIFAVVNGWLFWVGAFFTIEPYLETAAPTTWLKLRNIFASLPQSRQKIFRIVGIVALFFAFFQAWNDQYSGRIAAEQISAAQPSPYHWQLLSSEEQAALRSELRDIPPQPIFILCNGDDCGDLARSLRDVFNGLGWKANEGGWNWDNFDPGIQLWAGNDQLREIANKIERSTKGRLKIDPAKDSVIDKQQTQIVISIGPKP